MSHLSNATSGFLRAVSLVLVLTALAPVVGAQLADLDFSPRQLDADGGASGGVALQTNDFGLAVGNAFPPGPGFAQAGLWSFDGTTTLLPTLPGHEAGNGRDVNDFGDAVGESYLVDLSGPFPTFTPDAVVWIAGEVQALDGLVTGGAVHLDLLEAHRISNDGVVLGLGRQAATGTARPFVLDLATGLSQDLGSLSGPMSGTAFPFDRNQQGVVVGAGFAGAARHAVRWVDGQIEDLHDPAVILGGVSEARAINESGVIVGIADFIEDGSQFETATVWVDGVPENLGTLLGGAGMSWARDINEHGTIVGTSSSNGSSVHAIVYEDGVMTDLNDLIDPATGWILANAYSITNDGAITGDGFFGGGVHPFVAVPDGEGGFTVYGEGSVGGAGLVPRLRGQGFPDGALTLTAVNGAGGELGLLTFGSGTGVADVKPGSALQNLPLLTAGIPFVLTGGGPADGSLSLTATLPHGLVGLTVNLQAILRDPAASGGLAVTNPIELQIP